MTAQGGEIASNGSTATIAAEARRAARHRFQRIAGYAGAAVLVLYTVFVVVPAAMYPDTDGFAAYYTASHILLTAPRDVPRVYEDAWFQSRIDEQGFARVKDIYNIQAPTMTLLMAPVAWLSRPAARVVWTAAAVGCWLAACAILRRILWTSTGARSLVLFAAATTAYLPLRENFKRGQCYALLLLLLVLHLRLLLDRRSRAQWSAGLPLGLMLALKVAGAWLWPLLLLSRRWRTLLAAAATCVAVSLAGTAVFGWDAWLPYLRDLPRFASDPMRDTTGYQTVASLFGHLFTYDPIYSPRPVANLPFVSRAATALVTVGAMLHSVSRRGMGSDCFAARSLSLAVFVSLIVSLAPVAESYHYLLVLPAVTVAFWWAEKTRVAPVAWVALVSATALMMVPQKVYVATPIQAGWIALLAYPRVYGALLLWGWLAVARDRHLRLHACGDPRGDPHVGAGYRALAIPFFALACGRGTAGGPLLAPPAVKEGPLDASTTTFSAATAASVDGGADASSIAAGVPDAERPWWYPFGPFEDAEDARIAAKLQRGLESPGGIGLAIRRLCDEDAELDISDEAVHRHEVEALVARNFVIAHADRTYPALLDELGKTSPKGKVRCCNQVGATLWAGACFGYDLGGRGPELDAHPLAVERRSLAQRALVRAVEGGGVRAEEAVDLVLLGAEDCPPLHDIVRAMTPALIERLGTPPATPRVPRSFGFAELEWEFALRALSLGGADRQVAEAPVRAFLPADAIAPLAALALARMGADVTANVPQLARILDTLVLDDHVPPRGDYWDQLTRLEDTLDALREIGKPAHSALPSVAAAILRLEMPRRCSLVGAARYVRVVRAIATPADGELAARSLAPLLACGGPASLVVGASGELGAAGRPVLLTVLHDEGRMIDERLEAAAALRKTGQAVLAPGDAELVRLLQKKQGAWRALMASRALSVDGTAEVERCRAEAGLASRGWPWRGQAWTVATCTSRYLCGPAVQTYAATMKHCCHTVDPHFQPAFCPGVSDGGV